VSREVVAQLEGIGLPAEPEGRLWCLHCDREQAVSDLLVSDLGPLGVVVRCGYSGCDGGVFDLAGTPWWRDGQGGEAGGPTG